MIDVLDSDKLTTWILEVPSEIVDKEGFASGSKIMLTFRGGVIETQILPPTSTATKTEVTRIINKYDSAFKELKRIGD